jgi:hypothetical protein
MKKKSFDKPKFNPTKRDYFNLILVLGFFFTFFYLIINYLSKKYNEEVEFINSNCSFVKAKVVDKSVYKSQTLTVEYEVNGVRYKESDVFQNNDIEIGDSIIIKYSKVKPELIIIE